MDYETAGGNPRFGKRLGGAVSKDLMWTDGSGVAYPVREINEIIKYGLDELCESVDKFFEKYYRGKSTMGFAANPLSLTGEGIGGVKGAAEHIAKRLGRMTEIVCPDLPYYDKPLFSSRIALLATALSDKKEADCFIEFSTFSEEKTNDQQFRR